VIATSDEVGVDQEEEHKSPSKKKLKEISTEEKDLLEKEKNLLQSHSMTVDHSGTFLTPGGGVEPAASKRKNENCNEVQPTNKLKSEVPTLDSKDTPQQQLNPS
jgi:hypothetical protein